jgi:hypothetical protein
VVWAAGGGPPRGQHSRHPQRDVQGGPLRVLAAVSRLAPPETIRSQPSRSRSTGAGPSAVCGISHTVESKILHRFWCLLVDALRTIWRPANRCRPLLILCQIPIGDPPPVGSIESVRSAVASAGCLVPVRDSSYGKRSLARVRPVVFPTPNRSRSLSDEVVLFGPSPRPSATPNNETLTGGAQGQAGAAE